MNGEMYQICSIVAAGRKAIQAESPIKYIPAKYENAITFLCLPQRNLISSKKYNSPDVPTWFEYLKNKGLQDIKLFCPFVVKERQLLGFSNTTESSIVCFFKDGRVTYFVPEWQFDSGKKHWNVRYTEHDWRNPSSEKLCFKNNIESFRKALADIQDLAIKIECDYFAHVFADAISILNGSDQYPDKRYGLILPEIPQKNLQLFEAASCADVFGAMGSWNDSPPYMAHEKGLDKEYESLSAELLKNIRLAVLYAINEW